MTIKIDIKKTGFPVKIGTVQLWFDNSLENLIRFADIEKILNEKMKEAQEKAKHIHFPDETELEKMDIKTIDAAFDLSKEQLAIQYDIVFGDGAFKKVYKKYPDMLSLAKALDQAVVFIAKRIGELPDSNQGEAMKNEYLIKNAKKN